MAADATTELYSGSDDNYEVPLPAAGQAMIHPGTGGVMNAAATAADGEPDMAAESTKEQTRANTGANTGVIITGVAAAILLFIASISIVLHRQSKAKAAGVKKLAAASELDHQIHPTVI